ncbi:MAG TPA: small multi-drug export protein [Candidatus Thermoplasmatota archaeon]|nr:small multi-drug export protein [Candidatus Thermoplasmatota archaeon]
MGWLEVLIVFVLAPLPIVEMRLSIILGVFRYDLGWPATAVLTAASNLLAIPIIWALLPDLERLCRRSKRLSRWLDWLFGKARKEAGKGKETVEEIGLFVIVALTGLPFPVPGSGLYTALIAAYIFGLRMRKAFPWLAAGVLVAVAALMAQAVLFHKVAL